jgi:hypothetical protein
VNRKKGSDATVDMSEIRSDEAVKALIIQIAALSWATTQLPEITATPQSFRNAGFRSAAQVEFVVMIGDVPLHAVTKAAWLGSFRNLFLNRLLPAIFVERAIPT